MCALGCDLPGHAWTDRQAADGTGARGKPQGQVLVIGVCERSAVQCRPCESQGLASTPVLDILIKFHDNDSVVTTSACLYALLSCILILSQFN